MIEEQCVSQFGEIPSIRRFKNIQILILSTLLPTAIGLYVYQWSSIRRYLEPPTTNLASGSGTARVVAFDLSQCIVPTETLMSGGPPKDGIPALTNPKRIRSNRAKYLEPNDRVIGVMIGNEAVAYPIRILNYHECVNDVVGGRAIAVTYCPLCDSAFVFDREVGGSVLEFGISGLLLNSNVLLYDRQRQTKDESLWSQVGMRAICGPAAARQDRLDLVPSEMVTWRDWKRRRPGTEVLSPDTGYTRDYARSPYDSYFLNDRLMFPIREFSSVPPGIPYSYRNKEPVIVVKSGNRTKVYPYEELAAMADPTGIVRDQINSLPISLNLEKEAGTIRVQTADGEDASLSSAYTFWFAWRSLQDDYEVFQAE